MRRVNHTHQKGFTLIELLIAMTISLILIGALVNTFIFNNKTYAIQEQITDMIQNARTSVDMMSREIRLAGYQVVGASIPHQGSNTITFLGDVDNDIVTSITINPANAADTSISVDLNDSETTVESTDYIFITDGSHSDFIRATGFDSSGEPDTIHLHSGLINSYTVGSPVQTVEEITYNLSGTTLLRNNQPVAENIESLNFLYGTDQVTIQITARTSKQDPKYAGDGYRRKMLTTIIKLRNL